MTVVRTYTGNICCAVFSVHKQAAGQTNELRSYDVLALRESGLVRGEGGGGGGGKREGAAVTVSQSMNT